MNERITELAKQAWTMVSDEERNNGELYEADRQQERRDQVFAELIVKEMCGMMAQAEDDAYHCFEPSERPTEYIEWLRDWQERFGKHFGVES